jgi:hypothetical protein
LLKSLLEEGGRWKRFAAAAAQAKFAIQQTAAPCLVPPSQRSNSRFMNLGERVRWGQQTFALLDDPSRWERLPTSPDAVGDKMGWLVEFPEPLAEWSAYHE